MGHQRKFNRNRQRAQRKHQGPARPSSWGSSPSAPPPALSPDFGDDIADDLGFMFDMSLARMDPTAFIGFVSSTLALVDLPGSGQKGMRDFIERVGQDPTTNGHALLIGIAALAPMADDRSHATRLLADRSQADRDRLPSWIDGVEQATAVKAFAHQELWWDSSYIAIELQLGDHSLCVFADVGHVERYIVTKGNLYPGTIDAFLTEFPQVSMNPGTWTDYIGLGRAGTQLAEAVRRSDAINMQDVFLDDMWRPMRAEILWAARLAMAASTFQAPASTESGIDPLFDPDTSELTDAQVANVVRKFRQSRHGQQASADGVDKGIDLIVSYATTVGHARLENWGPRRAALFLHSYVLSEIWTSDVDLSTVPLLLEHWIRFVNERLNMPDSMGQETVDRIHEVIPIYTAILKARDESVRAAADDMVAARFRN